MIYKNITFVSNISGFIPCNKCIANINLSAWVEKKTKNKASVRTGERCIWIIINEVMNKYWVLHLPWIATCRHIHTPMIAVRSLVSWSFVLYYQIPAKQVKYFQRDNNKKITNIQSEKESNIRYHYTLYSLSAFWLAKSPMLILRIHMILWTSMITV